MSNAETVIEALEGVIEEFAVALQQGSSHRIEELQGQQERLIQQLNEEGPLSTDLCGAIGILQEKLEKLHKGMAIQKGLIAQNIEKVRLAKERVRDMRGKYAKGAGERPRLNTSA